MKLAEPLRRTLLFVAMLMSGGLLFIPRLPLLGAFFALYLLLPRPRLLISRAVVAPAVFVLMIVVLEALRPHGADLLQLSIRLANFGAGLLLLNVYLTNGQNALRSDLTFIIKWFAIQALATVLLATFVPSIFVNVPGTKTNTFLFVLNYHAMASGLSSGISRPDGFFWEPGVLQIYLNVYLYISLFLDRKRLASALALAAVVSTQSTAGIVIASVLLGIYFVQELRGAKQLQRRLGYVLIALIVAFPIGSYAYLNIANKLEGDARGSFFARQYDTLTGLRIALEHPWVGIGFEHQRYFEAAQQFGVSIGAYTSDDFAERSGNSNGVVTLLYSVGFPIGLVFLIGLLRQRLFHHRWAFAVIPLLGLMGEALIFTPFFLLFVFSGLAVGARRYQLPHGRRLSRSVSSPHPPGRENVPRSRDGAVAATPGTIPTPV